MPGLSVSITKTGSWSGLMRPSWCQPSTARPAYGVFTTIAQLLGDGGLAHLFGRWHTLKELPSCRLVTTAGLGPGQPQELEATAAFLRGLRLGGQMLLAGGEHEHVIGRVAEVLLKHADCLPDSWQSAGSRGAAIPVGEQRDQVGRFLSMLSFDCGRPSRPHVGHAAPSMYCRPVLECLGGDAVNAAAVWEAVLGLFRTRMRAAGPMSRGALPVVLGHSPVARREAAESARDLAARIITMADIDLVIRTAIANPRGYLPMPTAPRITRIGVKMEAGRCPGNSIERAEQLRLDYQNYWRSRTSSDPAARARQAQLRRMLLRICDEATSAVSASSSRCAGGRPVARAAVARRDDARGMARRPGCRAAARRHLRSHQPLQGLVQRPFRCRRRHR